MRSRCAWPLFVVLLGAAAYAGTVSAKTSSGGTRAVTGAPVPSAPVIDWSNEARRAIVPPSAGSENFGNKFPGEAGVYMAIVHAAIYDAAVAIEGGYEPYAIGLSAPDASPQAAIATAAYRTLVGLYLKLPNGAVVGLDPAQQPILDADYTSYMAAIPDGAAKTIGRTIGERVAEAVLALRRDDGREKDPRLSDLDPPAPGVGIWQPDLSRPVLGLRLPTMRPLALERPWQFRPDGPSLLTGHEYAEDFEQIKQLGGDDSTARTPEQTTEALFWTDHDARQWNDGLLGLAAARQLDLVQTARMLAMAHVAGADGLIACFDAKYHYWFWRPYQAIPAAGDDGNPATDPDPDWRPLRTTPNHPEYPSAHACHTSAIATVLAAFFGTDEIPFQLDSRVTGTTRVYDNFRDAVRDVNEARVLVGFHFFNSDQQGSNLGRVVGRYVTRHFFRPVG